MVPGDRTPAPRIPPARSGQTSAGGTPRRVGDMPAPTAGPDVITLILVILIVVIIIQIVIALIIIARIAIIIVEVVIRSTLVITVVGLIIIISTIIG